MRLENNTTGSGILAIAQAYKSAGLSVIPLKLDGSKHPALPSWKPYQSRMASESELREWFSSPAGIGIVCGSISGGLEVLDFDDAKAAASYFALTDGLYRLGVRRAWRVQTPSGGTHLYFRHEGAQQGNQKLAMTSDGKSVRIETRAEGGYVVAPGSPIGVHKNGGSYEELPVLDPEQRRLTLDFARGFDKRSQQQQVAPVVPVARKPQQAQQGERAGDAYNRQATWEEVLIPHGWRAVRTDRRGQTYWRRPGADASPYGATSNGDGTDRLFIFTSSTVLPSGMPLDKFTAYAWLNFNGSHADAARQLARDGFGEFLRKVG
jgi:hypothetical protein